MRRSHDQSELFQMVCVLYLVCSAQAGTVGNSSATNYTSTSFETEINNDNVYKRYSKDSGDQRSLKRQEIIKTGNGTQWSSADQTKPTETYFRSPTSTEPNPENQYRTNEQRSQSTSNYVFRGETMYSATLLPQNQEEEASCSHKCGQIQPFPCSCDLKCLIHQNCCEDMTVVCPEILHESQIRYGHMLGMTVECSSENIFLITECDPNTIQGTHKVQSATKAFQITRDYETDLKNIMDAINNAYVTDTTTGFVYQNWDVFSCAALKTSNPVKWNVIFQTRNLVTNKDLLSVISAMVPIQRPRLEAPKELGANLTAATCTQSTVGTCSDDWLQKDAVTVSRCQQFVSYVTVGFYVYTNKYCALCNGISLKQQAPLVLLPAGSRNNFDFSLTMSLSGSSLKVIAKIKTAVFVENECAISTGTQKNFVNVETVCSSLNCDIYSVRRPDGVCKRVYEMMIAIADDGFPFTADEYESFPEILYCFIKSYIPELDIDDNFYPTVPLFDNTLNATIYITRMFLFQNSSPHVYGEAHRPAHLYSSLSLFSQQYKSYRMNRTKFTGTLQITYNNSQLNQISTRLVLSTDGQTSSRESYKENRYGNLTTTCYCTLQLDTRVDYFHRSCDLDCFQAKDIDDEDILSTTVLTSQCRSLSGGQSRTAGTVSVYLWMIYFFLMMATVYGFL